jgi:hypothetical protein
VHGKDIPAVVKQNNRGGGGRGSSGQAQQPGEGEGDQQGEGDEALEFAEEEVSFYKSKSHNKWKEKIFESTYYEDCVSIFA